MADFTPTDDNATTEARLQRLEWLMCVALMGTSACPPGNANLYTDAADATQLAAEFRTLWNKYWPDQPC